MTNGLDEVFIEGLKVDAVIGVYDWERTITQRLVIDLSILTDHSRAADTDHIDYAVDYKTVCDNITELVQAMKANLIETIASKVADHIIDNFNASKVIVTVRKPTAVKEAAAVGVRILREAKPVANPL